MKKTLLAISFVAGLLMTACEPETLNERLGIPKNAILLSTERFSENGTKISVLNETVQWDGSESLELYVGTGSKQTRSVLITGGTAYISEELSGSGDIRGYYPAGLSTYNQTNDNANVKIPSEYSCSVSDGRQVIALPMVARANEGAREIAFKHITAAVNVKLKNSLDYDLYVDKVDLISEAYDLYANIAFALNLTASNLGVTPYQSNIAKNKVSVTFTGDEFVVPSGSSNKSIQVPIRPIGEDHLTVKVYCHSATQSYVYSYRPESAVSGLARNEMLTAQVDLNISGNMLAGQEVDLSKKSVNWTASDGDILFGTPGSSGKTCTIPNGATISLRGVTSNSSKTLNLKATGNATIILVGTNTLYGTPAITVADGYTLTIQGSGSLDVSAGYGGAAIGSNTSNVCGNIIINGGTIVASVPGGGNAAAIGCGSYGSCGTITINGGSVTATGSNAAGIGTTSASSNHSCGAITINGGTVTATGGTSSAGIGTGNNRYGTCGNISITGGTVTATGGSGAAGIGTSAYNHANNKCGTITIGAGVTSVTATKGSGATASIGKGNANSTCGTVTIADGANVTQN